MNVHRRQPACRHAADNYFRANPRRSGRSSQRGRQPVRGQSAGEHQKRKLRVDRILPLHGKIAPYGELVKAVQVTSTN